jgi:hypothetical protein
MSIKVIPERQFIEAQEFVPCEQCKKKSKRVGAQDSHDVYVCNDWHITRYKVGATRPEWKES